MEVFDLPSSGLKSAWTKVARFSFKIIHLYPLVVEPGRPLALPNLADPDLLVFHYRTVGRLPTQTHAFFMPYFEDF